MAKQTGEKNPISEAIEKNLRKRVQKEYGKGKSDNSFAIQNAIKPDDKVAESVAEIFNLTNQSPTTEVKNPKGTKAVQVWGSNKRRR